METLVKHPRLPVWPAWFGLVYIFLDFVTGSPKAGAALEDRFGGRVCPMIFEDTSATDPFLLVAHHRHSFAFLDPFRYIFRLLLPEGFPAHPHRGFETVTYVLRGGLVHRDSFGVKKSYGAPQGSEGSGEDGAVQWMTAGRGLRHEEMWRTGEAADNTDQELFQIWVNLPAASKMVQPRMQLLGNSEGANSGSGRVEVRELGPVPHAEPASGVTVRVIAGEACGSRSPVETYSDLAILHVTLAPGASWTWPKPPSWTCMVYARKGEATVGSPGAALPVHHTATLARGLGGAVLAAGPEGADLLLLAGEPLREPVQMGANIVMNTPLQLDDADRDLSMGLFGPRWRHTETDDDWQDIVAEHWERLEQALWGEAKARPSLDGRLGSRRQGGGSGRGSA